MNPMDLLASEILMKSLTLAGVIFAAAGVSLAAGSRARGTFLAAGGAGVALMVANAVVASDARAILLDLAYAGACGAGLALLLRARQSSGNGAGRAAPIVLVDLAPSPPGPGAMRP